MQAVLLRNTACILPRSARSILCMQHEPMPRKRLCGWGSSPSRQPKAGRGVPPRGPRPSAAAGGGDGDGDGGGDGDGLEPSLLSTAATGCAHGGVRAPEWRVAGGEGLADVIGSQRKNAAFQMLILNNVTATRSSESKTRAGRGRVHLVPPRMYLARCCAAHRKTPLRCSLEGPMASPAALTSPRAARWLASSMCPMWLCLWPSASWRRRPRLSRPGSIATG